VSERDFDLDELLGKPLRIKLGGEWYEIKDLSVEYAIKVSELNEASAPSEALKVLTEVLSVLGIPAGKIRKLDARQAMAAAAILVSSFTSFPDELLRRVPGLKGAQGPLASLGTTQSPSLSEVVEEAVPPQTS